VRLVSRGLGGRQAAEGAAGEGEPVGVMDQLVEAGVDQHGVPTRLVLLNDKQLVGQERGAATDPVFRRCEKVAGGALRPGIAWAVTRWSV
jgi:hypothetical protein